MATIQRIALQIMYEENIGAVLVPVHGWVFPEHVRRNEDVAHAVVARWFRKAGA